MDPLGEARTGVQRQNRNLLARAVQRTATDEDVAGLSSHDEGVAREGRSQGALPLHRSSPDIVGANNQDIEAG